MPTKRELQRRLDTIIKMTEDFFYRELPMLTTTLRLLTNIQEVAKSKKPSDNIDILNKEEELSTKELDHIIISCVASVKENPGGPSSVAFVIRGLNEKPKLIGRATSATSNNQAEYDAIYEALVTYFNLSNNPCCEVEIRSDSLLATSQLNGDMKCHDGNLAKRRDLILEFVKALPVPISFVWMPKNSTSDLAAANSKAQALLGVRKH